MELIWYIDRGTALASYPALWLATLTGVVYSAKPFGWMQEAAKKAHVATSVLATFLVLVHALLGVLDTLAMVGGTAPAPGYGKRHLYLGVAVGVGALVVLVVAFLAFTDPKRFERPWDPRAVHAFAYGAFALATVHAAAIGTDVLGFVRPAMVGMSAFLAWLVVLRIFGADRPKDAPPPQRT